MHSPRPSLTLSALASTLVLLGTLGCHGSSSGTAVYAYDQASSTVVVWNDVNALYNPASASPVGTIPSPDRTINVGSFSDGRSLAWGGAVVDDNRGLLYLLDEGGTVTIINNVSSKNGTYSSTGDVTSFTFGGSGDRFTSGYFGQAALDIQQNIFYALETSLDGSQTRVWYATSASQYSNSANNGSTVAVSNTFTPSNDTYGTGLATLPGSTVFGLFGGGSTLYQAPSGNNAYSGPRLRLGSSTSFPINNNSSNNYYFSSGVLIGNLTGLPATVNWGSLAYDTQNNLLFAFPQPSVTTDIPVLVFTRGQFTTSPINQAPSFSLTDSSDNPADLRTLSHPYGSDWLFGLDCTSPVPTSGSNGVAQTGTGLNYLEIWKGPSGGASVESVVVTLPTPTSGTAYQLRGVTMGGS